MASPRPYTLIAELTHRCPLRCPYCSNPIELVTRDAELRTEEWARVMREAEALGVMQAHMTGGEPLARLDLVEIVAAARAAGLYVNLITSGVPLTRARLRDLARAGLDNVQLSFQGGTRATSDRIAGYASFDRKMEVARWVAEEGLPLTVNVVLHRENIDETPTIIALAEDLGADRLELANAQYAGWALRNRHALLPSREAIDRARAVAADAKRRLAGRMEVIYVLPDYFSDVPKACMDGWGNRYVHVTPDGAVLPCHAARSIAGLRWETVRERSLADVWENGEAMNRYRGTTFLPEPCQSCEGRERDFGGCRCQAFALTGDASTTDPACHKSPRHALVTDARAAAETNPPRRYLHRAFSST